MIKAVLFDLGGVFFEDGTEKFLQLLKDKTNKSYDDLYPIFRKGKSLEYRENLISGKEFYEWASNQIDNIVSPDELNTLWVSQYTEIPGMRDIVLWLKSKDVKVGVLSDNVPERIEYLQKKYHFLELFDDVILSYEVKLTKDSSDIFNLALGKLKLPANEVIFVDDRQSNLDIAKQVGISSMLFNGSESLKSTLKEMMS